ncbi:MAG: M20/M25/M40 family metallo-hydrolase [Clostridia bacterium]|nr:M20/M25/M40 family metallo-hydrolase [Clostridia bacterium]
MHVGLIVLYCILGVVGALLLFMIVRTAVVRPTKKEIERISYEVDKNEAADILSGAVRIPTVTAYNEGDDQTPFLRYHEYLEKKFPLIFARAEKTVINNYSLVLKIQGKDPSLLPGCFLAHQDVVPATSDGWEVDPFAGEIKDGYVYGRGSQDMKSQLIASLLGLELLLREGKEPVRTIYYCFGHDEEFTGKEGAKYIVDYLLKNNIRFEFVVDEGGTMLDGKMIGIKDRYVALIGTCEKGYADYKLTATRDGGHASAPKKKSSVDEIAEAVYDLAHSPMKRTFSKPLKQMYRALAPYMNPIYKFFLINSDILGPILKPALGMINPLLNSAMRTTFAFTQLQGSDAPNVIPVKASAVVNVRINIGETRKDVMNHIQKVVGKKIEVSELENTFDPSPVSLTDTDTYAKLVRSIEEVYEGFVVAPYPFIAATDSKWYYKVSNGVYRFTPFVYGSDDQKRIHGLNERCSIDGLGRAVEFYHRLMENLCY